MIQAQVGSLSRCTNVDHIQHHMIANPSWFRCTDPSRDNIVSPPIIGSVSPCRHSLLIPLRSMNCTYRIEQRALAFVSSQRTGRSRARFKTQLLAQACSDESSSISRRSVLHAAAILGLQAQQFVQPKASMCLLCLSCPTSTSATPILCACSLPKASLCPQTWTSAICYNQSQWHFLEKLLTCALQYCFCARPMMLSTPLISLQWYRKVPSYSCLPGF